MWCRAPQQHAKQGQAGAGEDAVGHRCGRVGPERHQGRDQAADDELEEAHRASAGADPDVPDLLHGERRGVRHDEPSHGGEDGDEGEHREAGAELAVGEQDQAGEDVNR